jgi:hypothetical protein
MLSMIGEVVSPYAKEDLKGHILTENLGGIDAY